MAGSTVSDERKGRLTALTEPLLDDSSSGDDVERPFRQSGRYSSADDPTGEYRLQGCAFLCQDLNKIRSYRQLIGRVRRRTCRCIPRHQTAPRLHCVGKKILGDPHVPVVHRIPFFCHFDRHRRITAHRTNGQVDSCVCVDILRNTLVLDVDTPFKRGVLLHQRCLLLQILWTGSRFRNHFLHSGNQSRMVVQINTLHGFRIAWKYTG